MEDILAIVFLFGGGTVAAIAFSPIGRAIAERIRGKSAGSDEMQADLQAHRDDVQAELEAVRGQVGELAERLVFAERLLAQQREGQRLPRGAE